MPFHKCFHLIKLCPNAVFLLTTFMLAGCGGGSGSDPEPPPRSSDDSEFVATSSVNGAGGTIEPTSLTLAEGMSGEFTLIPDQDYIVGNVTGCSGILEGNTYSIQNLTDNCAVTASFVKMTATNFTVSSSFDATQGSLVPSQKTAEVGATLDFEINIMPGYQLDEVIGCGGYLVESGNTVFRIDALIEDCVINLTFLEKSVSNPDGDQMASSIRPVSADLDFDDNGSTEAIEKFAYDADGRIIQYAYSYIGDPSSRGQYKGGIFYYSASDKYTRNYQYNELGLLSSLEIINEAASNSSFPSNRFSYTYEYNETSQVTRSIQEQYDVNNELMSRAFFDFNYDDQGREQSVDVSGDDTEIDPTLLPAFVVRFDLQYDVNGNLAQVRGVNNEELSLSVLDMTYSPLGQLQRYQQASGADADSGYSSVDYSYDTEGCLLEELSSSIDANGKVESSGRASHLYNGEDNTLSGSHWDYDNDGVIDGSSTYKMEKAAYIPSRIPGIYPDTRSLEIGLYCTP